MAKRQSRAGVGYYSNIIYKTEVREESIPEQKLWKAVLNQVITDAFGPDRSEKTQFDRKDAVEYLTDKSNVSFNTVCEYAGLNPTYVFEKIKVYNARK